MDLLVAVVRGVIYFAFMCFLALLSVEVFKDFIKWFRTEKHSRIPLGIIFDRHKTFFAVALSVIILTITGNFIASAFLFLAVHTMAGNTEFWNRLARQPNSEAFFMDIMRQKHIDESILKQLFPECCLMETFTLKDADKPYGLLHKASTLIECLDTSDFETRVAALFHDVAKPFCYKPEDEDLFHNHAEIGADMTKRILTKIGVSDAVSHEIMLLIRYHETEIEPDEALLKMWTGVLSKPQLLKLLKLQRLLASNSEIDNALDKIAKIDKCIELLQTLN